MTARLRQNAVRAPERPGGAQRNGTFVRILPNGDLGFATFPGFGFGVGSVFLLDSLAELPTTGYVVASIAS